MPTTTQATPPPGAETVTINGQIVGFYTVEQNPFDSTKTTKTFHPYTPSSSGSSGTAPDPLSAATLKINEIVTNMQTGGIAHNDALDQLDAVLKEYAQTLDRGEQIATTGARAQTEATSRASVITDLLRRSTTAPSLDVPYLNNAFGGPMPGTPIDIAGLFDQGQGPLPTPADIQAMFPPQPDYPEIPNQPVPQPLDLSAFIRAVLAGSGGAGGGQYSTSTPGAPPPMNPNAALGWTGGAPMILPP